jgi:hypothetical protein
VTLHDLWPWLALALLGAYHGINPAMGWLFAVALGLQRRSRRAVLWALPPIAFGHEASIAVTVALVSAAEFLVSPDIVRLASAGLLVGFGLWKLFWPRRHRSSVGMQVGLLDLVVWSFLMSTAHGAGLMLLPVILGLPAQVGLDDALHARLETALIPETAVLGAAAVAVHSLAMLLVMGTVAIVVYEKAGLAVLRRAWINLDLVWGGAITVAGLVTLFT